MQNDSLNTTFSIFVPSTWTSLRPLTGSGMRVLSISLKDVAFLETYCYSSRVSCHTKQRTVLNGQASTWENVSAGVPQGSILGPLVFLIYINDLTNSLKCNVKLFADDKSLFTAVQDPNLASSDMNHDLNHIAFMGTRLENVLQSGSPKAG